MEYTKKLNYSVLTTGKSLTFPTLTFNCFLDAPQPGIGCVDVQSEVIQLFLSKTFILHFLFTKFFRQVLKFKKKKGC